MRAKWPAYLNLHKFITPIFCIEYVSEVRAASLIRAIIARISETSVDIQFRTRQYIPEDSELHTRRRENLKSHNMDLII
jgi:hypothetical protein